jgi:antibiotic biosynthesis monooxygenase (ABM) superfamily enzyme
LGKISIPGIGLGDISSTVPDSVIATIPVSGELLYLAFDNANGNVYVTRVSNNAVSVISGQTKTVIDKPISVGSFPVVIAFDSVRVINFSPYTLTMGGENQDTERASKEVTVVVNMRIKPGCEKDYDEWLGRFLGVLERKVPGYLGTTTIIGTSKDSTVRHIIYRFRDKVSLEAWESSQELHELTEEVNKYSTPYLQKATGLETWFTLPDLRAIVPPPKWKMAIVTFIGAYCISLLASFILRPYLGTQPLLFNLFMTIILVIGLTYFVMPLLSRLLRRWLYPKSL